MVAAFGISLTIKAAVGVSSFNSMNVAISELTKIEVGRSEERRVGKECRL